MRRHDITHKILLLIMSAFLVLGSFGRLSTVFVMAAEEKEIDISALSGFANSYTKDEKGKFEMDGVMVSDGLVYNVTVDGNKLQAWCGKFKSRTWSGDALIDLLDNPSTLFYDKVTGTRNSAEYTGPVEFTRPNGETY
ncbi:MAG: hypothetical protein K6E90_07465 [Lachnospiraceae bacterium]|nr:hypothetical protein [Lachnospiraceae bacterium]